MYGKMPDVCGSNIRILKALLSGRDEQFVGILVKGYHVTPQIRVHLRSVH